MTKSEAFRNILQSQELNDEIESMRKELVELIPRAQKKKMIN